MKKSKSSRELITDSASMPRKGYTLSPDELERVVAVFALFIEIDQTMKAEAQSRGELLNARQHNR